MGDDSVRAKNREAGRDILADGRHPHGGLTIVWLAVKPNGNPEMGTATNPEGIPPRAAWWCRVGDDQWQRWAAKQPTTGGNA